MKITLLCSDVKHPVNAYLRAWMDTLQGVHEVELGQRKSDLTGGEMLFLVSYSEIIDAKVRDMYLVTLVLHASDLPKGRGWSPHIWEIVNGAETITLSLLEAEDKVDSGRIWKKLDIPVPKNALWNEINHLLFEAEVEMINFAVENFGTASPSLQKATENASYYPKRTPADSRIDVNKSIAEQFDLIRVCDPNRFPAYFEHLGFRYTLKLEKTHEQ
ncbi:formyltransferase family protein [Limnohabitans sp.]|jgi:methionyl-tRNA formyltransferase|uniref:formyltransferase family protein n=1 Tax=Limnohabitans sp. TaxID=1907725 RepID=UPI0037BFD827